MARWQKHLSFSESSCRNCFATRQEKEASAPSSYIICIKSRSTCQCPTNYIEMPDCLPGLSAIKECPGDETIPRVSTHFWTIKKGKWKVCVSFASSCLSQWNFRFVSICLSFLYMFSKHSPPPLPFLVSFCSSNKYDTWLSASHVQHVSGHLFPNARSRKGRQNLHTSHLWLRKLSILRHMVLRSEEQFHLWSTFQTVGLVPAKKRRRNGNWGNLNANFFVPLPLWGRAICTFKTEWEAT